MCHGFWHQTTGAGNGRQKMVNVSSTLVTVQAVDPVTRGTDCAGFLSVRLSAGRGCVTSPCIAKLPQVFLMLMLIPLGKTSVVGPSLCRKFASNALNCCSFVKRLVLKRFYCVLFTKDQLYVYFDTTTWNS